MPVNHSPTSNENNLLESTLSTTTKVTYDELAEKCSSQQKTILDLNTRIAELEARFNQNHKTKPSTSQNVFGSNWMLQLPSYEHPNKFNVLSQDEYQTDSDELAKEFPNLENRKKRRRTKTKTPPKHATPAVKIVEENMKLKAPKIPSPPPINVSNIKNFESFRKKIIDIAKETIIFKALSNSDVKITVENETDYRKIKQALEEFKNEAESDKIQYHTFQLKSDKNYRIVIRGLPSSISQDEIKSDLEKEGHEVIRVTNIYKFTKIDGVKVRKDFPLFYIDLKQKDNNKEVFNIKHVAYCKVNIEPPKKAWGIPQCTNCQQLGHTKSFCYREAKCVKCAQNHHTKQCKKQPDVEPSCALCQQKGHTANYKGCPVYQKKIKSQTQTRVSVIHRLQTKSVKPQVTNTPVTAGLSFAQAAQPNQRIKYNEHNNNDIIKMLSQIQQTLGQLAERVGKLESNSKPPSKKSQQKHE